MLGDLLWKEEKKGRIIIAIIGSFIGLLMLLLSLQTYIDFRSILSGKAAKDKQFVLLNKRVNLLSMIGAKSTFNRAELEELKAQNFIKSVGVFTSNEFKVSASLERLGFYTELFFESVPNEFIDVETDDWHWEEGAREIPIILSRDYLALYNFGFAPSQGLPQFTQSTIRRVSFTVHLRGRGTKESFTGRIIGFSERLNSIIVPQEFMHWANNRFGNSSQVAPSRVLVETDNPYSDELNQYLKKQNYEVSQGRLIGGKLGSLLQKFVQLVGIIGLLIVGLSLLIFTLNFQLLISKAKERIRLLLQLGYPYKDIGTYLSKRIMMLFLIVIFVTFLVLFLLRHILVGWFDNQGFKLEASIHWFVYITAFLFILIFFLANRRIIFKNIKALAIN